MNLANRLPLGMRVEPYESAKLRRFAMGKDCALQMPWCDRDPSKVVLCHIRRPWLSGVAQKPHDFFGYHGCFECHRREREAGDDDILRALTITQARVYSEFGTLTP